MSLKLENPEQENDGVCVSIGEDEEVREYDNIRLCHTGFLKFGMTNEGIVIPRI